MTSIIRQLLDFARRRPLKKSPVELGELTSQAVDLLEPMARKSGVTLLLSRCDDPAFAHADAGQIQQVLTNQVVNAIQAMPQGGEIRLSIGLQDRVPPGESERIPGICIQVQDQGVGIPEQDFPHIFEPFFTTKVGSSTTGTSRRRSI